MKRQGSSVLSREAAFEIKTKYEEKDVRGRRIHSLMSLGKEYGVSETTILRAVKGFGAFMNIPEPLSDEQVAVMEKESYAKLQTLLATPKPAADRFLGFTQEMVNSLKALGQWSDKDEAEWQEMKPKT